MGLENVTAVVEEQVSGNNMLNTKQNRTCANAMRSTFSSYIKKESALYILVNAAFLYTKQKKTFCWCLFFGPYPSLLCSFKTTTFRGMALPRPQAKPILLDQFDRAIILSVDVLV
jgi:hypothetical protein